MHLKQGSALVQFEIFDFGFEMQDSSDFEIVRFPVFSLYLLYRKTPVWPSEYRPGWGQIVKPCGSVPTGMVFTAPVVVSMAYTDLSKRAETQRYLPSALTLPMSGLPPPGIGQFVSTLRVAKSMTEILPIPFGLV